MSSKSKIIKLSWGFQKSKHEIGNLRDHFKKNKVKRKKGFHITNSCNDSALLQGVLLPAIPGAGPRPPTLRVPLDRIFRVIQLYFALIQNLHISNIQHFIIGIAVA